LPPPAGTVLTSGSSWSDLGGTDAYIHGGAPRKLLIALTDALVRVGEQPSLGELVRLSRLLSAKAGDIRKSYGTLFGARAFKDLVLVAVDFAARERRPAHR